MLIAAIYVVLNLLADIAHDPRHPAPADAPVSAIADTGRRRRPRRSPAAHRPTGRLLRTALGLWRTRIGLDARRLLVAIAVFGRFFAPHVPDRVRRPAEHPAARTCCSAPTTSARTC